MTRYALVADLGGTKIAAARVHISGRLSHQSVTPTPPGGGQAVAEAIAGALARLPRAGVSALGVDVPGLAYPGGGVWAPNIPGWERMPLGQVLSSRFGLPVVVESDRNAFVTGEAWLGVARNCQDVIFVAVGTGIGAGIISGGRLIRGHAELAGCCGWMAVCERFRREYKAVGCLESHAAGPGITQAARRVYRETMEPRELARQARDGDPTARELIAEAGRHLGRGLANLVSILNPEMIVVGGGIAALGNLFLIPARETMALWAQPLAGKQVRITRSRLGVRAGLLGAAKLAFEAVKSDEYRDPSSLSAPQDGSP
jgi:glucokinase